MPIAFQQTNRPVPVVYSLNTEFQLCNNEKVFMMDPATADVSMAEMDYKGAFSMGTYIYIYICKSHSTKNESDHLRISCFCFILLLILINNEYLLY